MADVPAPDFRPPILSVQAIRQGAARPLERNRHGLIRAFAVYAGDNPIALFPFSDGGENEALAAAMRVADMMAPGLIVRRIAFEISECG